VILFRISDFGLLSTFGLWVSDLALQIYPFW
jgi:hypothetical protein